MLKSSDFSKAPDLEYSAVYLESIIQNLLSNALKYSSPLRIPKFIFNPIFNDKTVLTVCDNGLGIDLKEHGKEIFGFNKVSFISILMQKELGFSDESPS
jgi:signal transduction histidine kinase